MLQAATDDFQSVAILHAFESLAQLIDKFSCHHQDAAVGYRATGIWATPNPPSGNHNPWLASPPAFLSSDHKQPCGTPCPMTFRLAGLPRSNSTNVLLLCCVASMPGKSCSILAGSLNI